MKKGNALSIVLLVIIVILITVFVTLLFTGVISFNKPKSDEKLTEITGDPQIIGEELNVEENIELIDNMTRIISYSNYSSNADEYGNFPGCYFLGFSGDRITILSNDSRQAIAYSYYSSMNQMNNYYDLASNSVLFPKKLMEETIQKLFGTPASHSFEPTDFTYIGGKKVLYDQEKESYKVPLGLGGRFPVVIIATYKVEKKVEYYSFYQKALYIDYDYDDASSTDYTVVHLKNGEKEKINTIDFNKLELKPLDAYVKEYSEFSNQKAIMSNYYDRASEYKHVFKKDGNGNYIWHSSEKIK